MQKRRKRCATRSKMKPVSQVSARLATRQDTGARSRDVSCGDATAEVKSPVEGAGPIRAYFQ